MTEKKKTSSKKVEASKISLSDPKIKNLNIHADYLKAMKNFQESSNLTSVSKLLKDFNKLNLNENFLSRDILNALTFSKEGIAPIRLRNEISELETQLQKKIRKLQTDLADNKQKAEEVEELNETIEKLGHKREIQHLLDSVTSDAHSKLESDKEFRGRFASEKEVKAFVVSVDIRRSTELMLKARSPKLFSDFITTLCSDLVNIFKRNFAVVDKFTGDGILAFFPAFYSGCDSGYYAIKSAKEANEAFKNRYKEYRTSFSTILRDVGLGTGIDYGDVHLVRMAGALTIVGQPVVYACRLGGAPAGKIFLNQPAFEIINEKYPHVTTVEETSIEIKSEGSLVCYEVQLSNANHKTKTPAWLNEDEG